MKRLDLGARLVGLALLAAAPRSAHANYWDLYGMTPRALGMANCQTAVADDSSAVFYNPAALASATASGYGLSFSTSLPSLSVAFERDPATLAAAEPAPASAIGFGTHFLLAGSHADRRLALGLAFSLPTRSLLSGQALDPAIPQWYLYNALPERLAFAIGLAARPFDWLSLGAGLQVLAGLDGALDYQLDIVAGRFSKKTVTFDIEPRGAPIVGLEVRPLPHLRLGVAWRGSIATDVTLPVDLAITGIADLRIDTAFLVQYLPHEVVFGASYWLEPWDLLLTADVQWSHWSDAPDPSVDSRIDAGGELLEGTGLAEALDTPAVGQSRSVELGLTDVFMPRFALEKKLGPAWLRAGYGVRPSGSPVQTSGANYIDGTAHTLALGAGVRVRDPWALLVSPITLEAAGSLAVLPSRTHTKVDPSDAVGSYTASGTIFVVSVGLRYAYEEVAPPSAPTPEVGPAESDAPAAAPPSPAPPSVPAPPAPSASPSPSPRPTKPTRAPTP